MKKRIWSILLVLCMALALLPVSALGTEGGTYGSFSYEVWDGEVIILECDSSARGYITVPEKINGYPVTRLQLGAFSEAKELTQIALPNTLKEISSAAFSGCTGLKSITIPKGITVIEEQTFMNCKNLESVILPYGVTRLDHWSFRNCTSLKTIKIPESVTEINGAFESSGLESVTLPKSLKVLGANSFTRTKIQSIVIPDGVKEIDYEAFSNCSNLKSIQIPASVTRIDTSAFFGTFPQDIYFTGTKAQWDAISVGPWNDSLKSGVIHYQSYMPAQNNSPFRDVPTDQYYYEPVIWAVEHDPQITNGMAPQTFSPDTTCTRGQVVTFLWRTSGCPEPKSTSNSFRDVSSSAYYYKAVLWALEKGITNGTSRTTFSPDAPCTRAHVVTFLWRGHGQPKSGNTNPFRDVPAGEYYTAAVLWAVSKNITNGTSAHTFSPDQPCTRGQIVTFLYRAET